MEHAKGADVIINKYKSTFLFIFLGCYGSQVYTPTTYSGINAVTSGLLYPGDTVVVTLRCSAGVKDKDLLDKTMTEMGMPVFDARYFTFQQASVNVSYGSDASAQHGDEITYTITRNYVVQQVADNVQTTLNFFSLDNHNFNKNITSKVSIDIATQNTSPQYNIAYLPSSQVPPNASSTLPFFQGTVYTENQLGKRNLYPGDVIKIENLQSACYQNGTLVSYDTVFMPHADLFDVYQDPNFSVVPTAEGNTAIVTTWYYVVKDAVVRSFKFNYMRWHVNVGPLKGSHTYGEAQLTSMVSIGLMPLPQLFQFVRKGTEFYRRLLAFLGTKNGCTTNSQDADGRTPLMWSIFYNEHEIVKFFATDPLASLAPQDKDGRTALMYAAQSNNQDIVSMLLPNKSTYQTIPLQDKDGMTALHYGAWNNNYTIIQDILLTQSMKPFINVTNKEGITALMYAAARGNKKAVQLLLSNNADYTLVDKNGFNCLFYACFSLNPDLVKYLYGYIAAKDAKVAQSMIQAVAVDKTTILYNTLLIGNTDANLLEIVQFLLGQGVSPSSSYDPKGAAALQSYLQHPNMERGTYGSLLECVAHKGTAAQQTFQLLMQKGAVVTPATITLAQKNSFFNIIKSYSDTVGPALYQALYKGDTARALLLAQQFSPQVSFAHTISNYANNGWSVLFLLAYQAQGNASTQYNPIAAALIERGANTSVIGSDAQGNPITPMVLAMNNGNTELQTLLQKGGSILSQHVANSIAIQSGAAGVFKTPSSDTVKQPQVNPSGLMTGSAAQVNTAAIPQVIEVFDSIEYLLG